MSRTVVPFNRLEITNEVLSHIQDNKDELIQNLLKDQIQQPGILMAANTSASGIEAGLTDQLSLTITPSNQANIGPGVAYNANGDRIEIRTGDAVAFNPLAPAFTAQITGVASLQNPPISYSTGSQNVFNVADIPPVPGPAVQRFVFIQYQQVVRTVSYLTAPSNHATGYPTAVVYLTSGSPDTQKPLLELDSKIGLLYAPHKTDGYKIIVATPAELNPSPPTATPMLLADATAIYLGSFFLTSGGVPDPATVDMSNRQLLQLRPTEVGTLRTLPTDRTSAYALGQAVTMEEHVNALGTATSGPTAANPHAYAISDIEGGGAEPLNRQYQSEVMAEGILDPAVARNGLLPTGSAMEASISNILPTPYVSFLTTTGQAIYVLGIRINPTTDIPATIEFPAGTPIGEYTIYVSVDISTTTPAITLAKTIVATSPIPTRTTTFDYLVLATVYWNGTALRKSPIWDSNAVPVDAQESVVRPRDARTLGLVSTKEISTKALNDPNNGLLARQTFRNGVLNPEFALVGTDLGGVSATEPFGWTLNQGAPFYPVTGSAQARINTSSGVPGPTLPTDDPGPKTLSANKLTFPATAPSGLHVQLLGAMSNLKPNTVYTITAWFKVTRQTFPSIAETAQTIAVFGRFSNSAGTTSYTGKLKEFVLNNSTFAWQRATIVLQTDSTPSPLIDNRLDIRFISQNLSGFPYLPADIYLASVMATEGEWALGAENTIKVFRRTDITGDLATINGTGDEYTIGDPYAPRIFFNFTVLSKGQWADITVHIPIRATVMYSTVIGRARGIAYIVVDGVGLQGVAAFDVQKIKGTGTAGYWPTALEFPMTVRGMVWLPPGPRVISAYLNLWGGCITGAAIIFGRSVAPRLEVVLL